MTTQRPLIPIPMPVPVRIVSSGTPGRHVHALINTGRISCYQTFTSSQTLNTPGEMVTLNLSACPYCWPRGIRWPDA